MRQPRARPIAGFTIVEVMMAATILVVAFVGMIQAVTIGSEMMATARRQTLANQIIANEVESLRLQTWETIQALPTSALALGAAWDSGKTYSPGDLTTNGTQWYRCQRADLGSSPAGNPNVWRVDPPPYSNVMTTSGAALGAIFTLTRSVNSLAGDTMREVTFQVQWSHPGSPVASRRMSAYFTRYGLNLNSQR